MSFLVISLGFFIERIISSNKDTLASFFHICIPLLPSLFFMALANAASDVLKVEQVSILVFFLISMEMLSNSIRMMVAVGILYVNIIMQIIIFPVFLDTP